MDCWILTNVYVEREKDSDGWRFLDQQGNMVFIAGDVKVIRVNDESTPAKYHEYHYELEAQTYREKFNQ